MESLSWMTREATTKRGSVYDTWIDGSTNGTVARPSALQRRSREDDLPWRQAVDADLLQQHQAPFSVRPSGPGLDPGLDDLRGRHLTVYFRGNPAASRRPPLASSR